MIFERRLRETSLIGAADDVRTTAYNNLLCATCRCTSFNTNGVTSTVIYTTICPPHPPLPVTQFLIPDEGFATFEEMGEYDQAERLLLHGLSKKPIRCPPESSPTILLSP